MHLIVVFAEMPTIILIGKLALLWCRNDIGWQVPTVSLSFYSVWFFQCKQYQLWHMLMAADLMKKAVMQKMGFAIATVTKQDFIFLKEKKHELRNCTKQLAIKKRLKDIIQNEICMGNVATHVKGFKALHVKCVTGYFRLSYKHRNINELEKLHCSHFPRCLYNQISRLSKRSQLILMDWWLLCNWL